MNNGELKNKLASYSHRNDLAAVLQGFVNTTSERLNQRFGLSLSPMNVDTDSNSVIANHGESLYFYGSARELSLYIKDFEEAVRFDELFDKECRRMNIHVRDDEWVTDATTMTWVMSEEERAVIAEKL